MGDEVKKGGYVRTRESQRCHAQEHRLGSQAIGQGAGGEWRACVQDFMFRPSLPVCSIAPHLYSLRFSLIPTSNIRSQAGMRVCTEAWRKG